MHDFSTIIVNLHLEKICAVMTFQYGCQDKPSLKSVSETISEKQAKCTGREEDWAKYRRTHNKVTDIKCSLR